MEKGASQSWQEILQEVIGEGRLDGTALREFFAPLEEWLRQENLRNNEFVGWNYDGDYCKHRSVGKKSQRMQPPVIIDSFYNFNFFLLLLVFSRQRNAALTQLICRCMVASTMRLQLNCSTLDLHSRWHSQHIFLSVFRF